MSINITVRPSGTTTGGTNQTIEGDGAIDTRAEAEAALTFLPDGSTDSVVVGSNTFTRAQLIEIRDRTPAVVTPVVADGGTTAADGMANGVEIQGYGAGGVGDRAHHGGGVRASWVPSWRAAGDEHTLHFDLPVGLDIGHFSMDYEHPGGGAANSAFTRYGLRVAPTARWVPPWADRRLSLSLGLGLGVGGFTTADSNMVSVPPTCVPDDFGREECLGGPRTGNAGDRGVFNPRLGNSRGTSGAYLDVGIPLTFGVNFARGDWGNVGGFLSFEPGYTQLMPSDGDGFSFWSMRGGLGIRGSFGGSAVERPRRTEPTGPVASTTPDAAIAQGEGYSVAAPEGGWRSGDQVLLDGTALTDPAVPTSGSDPYVIPTSRLGETPNPHTIVVRYTRDGRVHERTTRVAVNPPVAAREDGTASGNGFALAQVLRVDRPALVPGVAPAPLNIGSIVSEASVPAGMRVEIRINGETVGDPIPLVRDGRTRLTIPASVPDTVPGAAGHSVEFRILDSTGTVRHRFVGQPITVAPATRIGTPAPAMGAASYVNYGAASRTLPTAIVNITGTTPIPGVTVRVNNHEYTVTLNPGLNTLNLVNPGISMRTNLVGATAGTYPVTITIPGEAAPISLSLVITRRTGTPGPVRPRLPGAGSR